jgi:hypothetical protein
VDCLFDPVQLADAVERLLGDRRTGCGMHVEELSSYMRPTGRLGDAVAGEQFVEPGIPVGMDDAAEFLQVISRMLPFTVRRIEEQRRWRPLVGKGTLRR